MNVKKLSIAFLLLIASLLLISAPAQMTDKTVQDGTTAVTVGRTRAVTEKIGGDHSFPALSELATFESKPNDGQMHNPVMVVARHPKAGCAKTEECGEIFMEYHGYNLVTNAGLNWLADIMSNTSTPSVNAQCNYIGLSNGAGVPAAADTALATTVGAEIAANGLSRAQATYAHTANATTYTLAKTFTASGAQAAQAGAVFTASSSGTMCFEDTFTAASLQTNDTLTVTWTITI